MPSPLAADIWGALGALWTFLGSPVGTFGPIRVSVLDVLWGALIGVWAAFKAHGLRVGSEVNRGWLLLEDLFLVLVAFWIIATTFDSLAAAVAPSQWIWGGPYFALWLLAALITVCLGMWLGVRHGRRELAVERSVLGEWILRGTWVGLGLWLLLVALRMGIEDGLLYGYSVFLPLQPLPPVPLVEFFGLVLLVGELYLLGFGFELGYNVAIWGHRRARVREAKAARRAAAKPAPGRGTAEGPVRAPFRVPALLPPIAVSRSGGQLRAPPVPPTARVPPLPVRGVGASPRAPEPPPRRVR
jgi:hypothetical protein